MNITPVTTKLDLNNWDQYISLSLTPTTTTSNNLTSFSSSKVLTGPYITSQTNSYADGIIFIDFTYSQSVENWPVLLSLNFDDQKFTSSGTTMQFSLDGKNSKLLKDDYLNFQTLLQTMALALAIGAAVQFIFSMLVHKMMGLETIQVVQGVYFLRIITELINPTLVYSLEPLRYTNGYNGVGVSSARDYTLNRFFTKFSFSKELFLNINIDLFQIVIVWLIFTIIYLIVRKMEYNLANNNFGKSKEQYRFGLNKIIKVKGIVFSRFIFGLSIFPLMLICFTYMASMQLEEQRWNSILKELTIFFVLSITYIALFLFWEVLQVYNQKDEKLNYYKENGFKPFYERVYLVYILLFSLSIMFSCLTSLGIYVTIAI